MPGQFRNQPLGDAGFLGRLALDREVTAERGLGRGVERAIDLAGQASEPDQLGLRRAEQLR